MKRLIFMLVPLCLAVASFAAEPRPRALDKAAVLPLALDDNFQFRKTITFLNDSEIVKPAANAMINFEYAYINYGAINSFERRQRYGNYYKFFWRSSRKADLTVRFEYRQQHLGAFVQAKEYTYPAAKGSFESQFKVVGNDYFEDGRVSGWRVLLIENGKIVGLTQSFLWD